MHAVAYACGVQRAALLSRPQTQIQDQVRHAHMAQQRLGSTGCNRLHLIGASCRMCFLRQARTAACTGKATWHPMLVCIHGPMVVHVCTQQQAMQMPPSPSQRLYQHHKHVALHTFIGTHAMMH